MTDILNQFVARITNGCTCLISFVQKKAINRQYHTYFDWNGKSANSFFGLFGEQTKKEIIKEINSDNSLEEGVKAFMEIGALRNIMVHEDYVSFPLDLTAEEVYELYTKSQVFISYFSVFLSSKL